MPATEMPQPSYLNNTENVADTHDKVFKNNVPVIDTFSSWGRWVGVSPLSAPVFCLLYYFINCAKCSLRSVVHKLK
jgi:hypothetical protein